MTGSFGWIPYEWILYGAAGLVVGFVGGIAARRIVTARGSDIEARRWLPVLPVATAALTAGLYVWIGATGNLATPAVRLAPGLGVATLLVLSAGADLCGRIIPNEFMAAGALAGFLFLYGETSWMAHIFTTAGSIAGGIAIQKISRRASGLSGIGMGDVKLVAVLGLWMGPQALWAVYLGVVLAAGWGILLVVSGLAERKARLPFAPFVLAGFLLHGIVRPIDVLGLVG